ncbi:MAG: twin-arginine translocase TatA/TatE family subunit [Planctomycetes bacterium]|nr:twin-arginine translocase TatA/TatE family subunit [Planctomycetota bacterium]
MFDSIGWLELFTVGVVALLVYGKSLPRVAREAGKVLGDLKRGLRNLEDDLKHQVDLSIEEEQRSKSPPVALVPAPPFPELEASPSPGVPAAAPEVPTVQNPADIQPPPSITPPPTV